MYRSVILGNEAFTVFENDNGVSKTISETASYGIGEIKIYEDILNEGDVFFNVGMNIGAISFQLKNRKHGLKIFGFEPVKEFFHLATQNLSSFNDVTCLNMGAGAEDGAIDLRGFALDKVSNFGAAELRHTGTDYQVAVRRLDCVDEISGVSPTLVKIDVEGQEDKVLQGMAGIIHKNLYISIEADRPETVKKYIDFLKKNKFDLYFGHLAMTDRTREGRNTEYDARSTIHIFACFLPPTPWMKRLLKNISNFDDYLQHALPILQRS